MKIGPIQGSFPTLQSSPILDKKENKNKKNLPITSNCIKWVVPIRVARNEMINTNKWVVITMVSSSLLYHFDCDGNNIFFLNISGYVIFLLR